MSIKTKTLLILFLSVSIIFALIIEAIGKDELILITNTRDGTISVISRTKNEVIKTINAGKKSNRLKGDLKGFSNELERHLKRDLI